MNISLTYRKRVITQDDLTFIRKVIDDHQSKGRSAISRILCEAWDWRQANGHLKDGVCRGFLLQLERKPLVTIEKSGTVIYRSKMSHGGNKRNFMTFSPLEFIAAVIQHIPEQLAQMLRYVGWCSNRMRGDR